MIDGHGATEDGDDDGDGNSGRRCRGWTTMAMADSDGDGDGDVADGQQRRCWTATAMAMTRMGNNVDGGRRWRRQ
jgi:hypothetical protein